MRHAKRETETEAKFGRMEGFCGEVAKSVIYSTFNDLQQWGGEMTQVTLSTG